MTVALRSTEEGVFIPIRAQPRGGRTAIVGVRATGALEVRVGAPPVDGAANDELVRYLARDVLRVAPSRLRLVQGQSGRDKVVRVEGLTLDEVSLRLAEHLT